MAKYGIVKKRKIAEQNYTNFMMNNKNELIKCTIAL